MANNKFVFRVHPTINFARFGTSDEFYLSPETSAGIMDPDSGVMGGLPIKAGTEKEPIQSSDLRDKRGRLKNKRPDSKFLFIHMRNMCIHLVKGQRLL